MNFSLKIKDIKSINDIIGYWTNDDFINLLDVLDYPDAKSSSPSELRELLEMALNDLEPHESAEIVLRYKLQDNLNAGQIRNLSHEMAADNEAEEYPDINFHYPIFNINQLLHRAYNGIFPNAKATKLEIELVLKGDTKINVSKELVLKAISHGLSDRSPLVRLFEDQLNGSERFSDAEKVIWELHDNGQNQYTIITSDYWINKEDINEDDFSGSIKQFEDKAKHKPVD